MSLKYPFLAIHAKGGEIISPKQKDRTTTNFHKFELKNDFSIGVVLEFQCSSTLSNLISKTLLITKRRILLMGSFCLVKGKAFETGEKISNLENASQNLTHLFFDYLQKKFEKNLQKNLQKQNMWCKHGPKY
jgi:hypothetical protein